jgi:cell wall-associated NlpC family hydrolase
MPTCMSRPSEQRPPQPVVSKNLRRGDLVFWPGHVAIMRDAQAVVHANSFQMAVT